MKTIFKAALLGAAATALFSVTPAMAAGGVCLITKNNTNPYPVAMAEKRALSRVVLKLVGMYELGVMGEDEL